MAFLQGCWDDLTVGDIMSPEVLAVRSDDSIFKAMEILVEEKCSGLAVIGEDYLFQVTYALCDAHLSVLCALEFNLADPEIFW